MVSQQAMDKFFKKNKNQRLMQVSNLRDNPGYDFYQNADKFLKASGLEDEERKINKQKNDAFQKNYPKMMKQRLSRYYSSSPDETKPDRMSATTVIGCIITLIILIVVFVLHFEHKLSDNFTDIEDIDMSIDLNLVIKYLIIIILIVSLFILISQK